MKKILILVTLFALFLGACVPVGAQTSTTPSDPVSYMTPTQKLQYESDIRLAELQKAKDMEIAKLENKVKQYGEWVGVGGEVGSAIEEGLTAVVDVADKFGKTDVGKFTLVLVAWKVMGKDVIKIILGLLFFGVLVFILVRIYRNTIMTQMKLIKRTSNGFWRKPTKEWETVESELDGEQMAWMTVAVIVAFLLGIWITYGIMF